MSRLIIYYRNTDGKITYHHQAPKDKSEAEIRELAAEFNYKKSDKKAFIVNVQENSFEAYLLDYANEKKQRIVEDVTAALDALNAAMDAVRDLEA